MGRGIERSLDFSPLLNSRAGEYPPGKFENCVSTLCFYISILFMYSTIKCSINTPHATSKETARETLEGKGQISGTWSNWGRGRVHSTVY